MSKLYHERMTSLVDHDFVVFVVGMRVNHWWRLHKWLPVARAMTAMLEELYANPELGLISHEQWFFPSAVTIQYWRSLEHLNDYAKNRNAEHLPAWSEFNRRVAASGEVGIWHETYCVSPGRYECIYHHMPSFGLGKVGQHLPAAGVLRHAEGRMQANSPVSSSNR